MPATPLSAKRELARIFAGAEIIEAYGQTEGCGVTTLNPPGAIRLGTVGPAVPGVAVRIADDGEILAKGCGVFSSYHDNEAATREAIVEGWFHTGDIGVIENGILRITDRKKDIIVNAGGKNIAPQNLENVLKTSPYISQVMVHGDERAFLSALVTLNEANVKRWIQESEIKVSGPLHEDRRIRRLVQEAVDALNAKQASYSRIKKFAIVPTEFTLEGGELTPTLKVKRKVVTKNHQRLIDAMYAEEGGRGPP